ncbi:MAG: hypothetical protein AAB316_12550, partial [Bacteroidota bacterium]
MTKPVNLLPFEPLLDLLRLHGFRFGVDTRMRLERYWQLVLEEKHLPWEALRSQLAALLCRSEEQQQKFQSIFDKYLSQALVESFFKENLEITPPPPPPTPEGGQPPPPTTTPPPVGKRKKTAPPPELPPASASMLEPVFPLLNFPDNPLRAWNLAEISPALTPLQEKEWMETSKWDVPATLRATIRAGGLPTFIPRRRKRAPRYLALIEQQSPRDHFAGFAAELVRELNRRDLEADYYFFEKSPARCWKSVRDLDSHVHLEWLKTEWEGARLLLIGTASNFINLRTGEPSNLALDLPDAWEKIALLATNSPLEWGAAEQILNGKFPVV